MTTALLTEEGTNRLKKNTLSEVYAMELLIVGKCEQLTAITKQQRQVASEFDKFQLKRNDTFLHEQSNNTKLKTIQ